VNCFTKSTMDLVGDWELVKSSNMEDNLLRNELVVRLLLFGLFSRRFYYLFASGLERSGFLLNVVAPSRNCE
jgi:hypothetical protein